MVNMPLNFKVIDSKAFSIRRLLDRDASKWFSRASMPMFICSSLVGEHPKESTIYVN